jgi:hypothetical protein
MEKRSFLQNIRFALSRNGNGFQVNLNPNPEGEPRDLERISYFNRPHGFDSEFPVLQNIIRLAENYNLRDALEMFLTAIVNYTARNFHHIDRQNPHILLNLPEQSQIFFVIRQEGRLGIRLPRNPINSTELYCLLLMFRSIEDWQEELSKIEYRIGFGIFSAPPLDTPGLEPLFTFLNPQFNGGRFRMLIEKLCSAVAAQVYEILTKQVN